MDANVLVGENLIALPYNKATKWPITRTDLKFTATRVIEFVYAADFDLNYLDHGPHPVDCDELR